MTPLQNRHQLIFPPENLHYKPLQRCELIVLIAQKYLSEKDLISVRSVNHLFHDTQFDSRRALRLEELPPNSPRAWMVSATAKYWHRLSQQRWTETHEENSFQKTILSASSCVNLNIYWRAKPSKIKYFERVVFCREVAFDYPHVMGLTKIIKVFEKSQSKGEKKILGIYLYLKFLGGNPDNLISSNRVEGCTRALVAFLVQRCVAEKFKGIYLEALKPAEIVFTKLGFEKLDKDSIECRNSTAQPMHRIVISTPAFQTGE